MRALVGRRPEVMLMMSVMVFVAVLVGRLVWQQESVPLSVNADAPPPAPLGKDAADTVAAMQAHLRANPDDAQAYTLLGMALLQRVRETADPSLYTQAGQALDEAIKREPQQLDALIGQGALALARHQFDAALRWGEQAQSVNPYRAQVYGIIGDAQIELGRYDEAEATFQQMVNTRPDLSSYSRVSYLRELRGDTEGAIQAMQMAVQAGGPATENTLWTQVQLGHLYFGRGDLVQAEQTYMVALQTRSDYIHAFAGVARVRAAQGQHAEAIGYYKTITERVPLPEYVLALGDLYARTGKTAEAQAQYDLVRVMQQLNAGAGMDVDLELALFDADYGTNPAQAVERAQAAYAKRPSIHAADALAWALHKHGQHAEAQRYSREALRLGTRDAALHYRAGVIAHANGDTATARTHLQLALDINPYFSLRHAPEARQLLDKMTR